MPAVVLIVLLLAAPTCAAAQVEQRAVERVMDGIFIRGGSTVINVEPHCPAGCPEGQRCEQICEERPCPPGSPSDAVCNSCRWQCDGADP